MKVEKNMRRNITIESYPGMASKFRSITIQADPVVARNLTAYLQPGNKWVSNEYKW